MFTILASFINVVRPIICDGWPFIRMTKALARLTDLVKREGLCPYN